MASRKAIATVLLVGGVAFAASALLYRGGKDVHVDFERGYEGSFVEGFHPRERAEGKYFRWTDESSFVELHHLPRRGTFEVDLVLKTIRPAGADLPSLAFTANGVTLRRARAFPGVSTYRLDVPSSTSRLRLGIESETFESGGRKLGVQVLGVTVKLGGQRPSWLVPALFLSLTAMLIAAAGVVCRLPLGVAGGAGLLLGLALVHLTTLQAALFSSYPRDVSILAGFVLAAAALIRLGLDRLAWLERGESSVAAGILAFVLLLKLGAVTYPLTLSSDAEFQANRMRQFLQGNLHPTSETQHDPPFRFPYPVALYAVAAPLAKLGVDLVPSLEVVTALFDVVVSGLLLFLGWRFLDDFRAGAIAAVLYPLVPMNVLSFSAGNFTNIFAVSMLATAFSALLLTHGGGSRRAIVAFLLTTFLALTAHFGMLIEGIVLWPVWLLLLGLAPAPSSGDRGGLRLLSLAAAAAFLAAGLYYLGYLELFTSQFRRAAEGNAGPAAGDTLLIAAEQLGWVLLATAILGSLAFVRRPLAGALAAAVSGWLLVTAFFLGADLVTPLEIRYWLQALPLLAFLAGAYLSRAWDRGVVGKTAATAAFLYMAATGLWTLYRTMVFSYH
jgi:hypothetical protein